MISLFRRLPLLFVALMFTAGLAQPGHAQTGLGISSSAGLGLVALAPAGSAVPDLRPDVLEIIPDDAWAFAVATNPIQTKDEIETVLRKLKVPFEDEEDYLDFNRFLSTLKGWDSKGTVAFALLPEEPIGDGFIAVPVTDYKAFVASLGGDPEAKGPTTFARGETLEGVIAEKSGYAIIGDSTDLKLIEKVLDSKKSIASTCDPIRGYLAKHKTAIVFAPAGTPKLFNLFLDSMKQYREFIPDEPESKSAIAVLDMLDEALETLRDEGTFIAIGGIFNERIGADLSLQILLKPEGKLAAIGKEMPKLPAEPFVGLPDDTYFFTAAGVLPKFATEAFAKLSVDILDAVPDEEKLTPEKLKELRAAMREVTGVRRASTSMHFGGATLMSDIGVIYEVDDAAKFIEANAKAIEAMKGYGVKDKTKSIYSLNRIKLDSFDALETTADAGVIYAEAGEDADEDEVRMFKTLLGPSLKLNSYFVAVDQDTVVFAYDQALAKRLAAAVKAGVNPLGEQAELKKTTALLLPEPNLIGFVDLAGTLDIVKKFAILIDEDDPVLSKIPPFFPTSPPLGAAAKFTPRAMELQIVAPMKLMENAAGYIHQLEYFSATIIE